MHTELQSDCLQAQALSHHTSPGRKRSKSGPGPSASQPGIEMFMRQAPPPAAAAPSSREADTLFADDVSDDDDAPMVAAVGTSAASRAPAVMHAAVSHLQERSAPVAGSRSSSSAAAQAPPPIGSKRAPTAAVSACNPQRDIVPLSVKTTAVAAAASLGADVSARDGEADVLEIDDLDSLFAL